MILTLLSKIYHSLLTLIIFIRDAVSSIVRKAGRATSADIEEGMREKRGGFGMSIYLQGVPQLSMILLRAK